MANKNLDLSSRTITSSWISDRKCIRHESVNSTDVTELGEDRRHGCICCATCSVSHLLLPSETPCIIIDFHTFFVRLNTHIHVTL
jgi:hypothetical protein